jgi:hypothetical protein
MSGFRCENRLMIDRSRQAYSNKVKDARVRHQARKRVV